MFGSSSSRLVSGPATALHHLGGLSSQLLRLRGGSAWQRLQCTRAAGDARGGGGRIAPASWAQAAARRQRHLEEKKASLRQALVLIGEQLDGPQLEESAESSESADSSEAPLRSSSACPEPSGSDADLAASFRSALEACRHLGRWDEALQLFDRMGDLNLSIARVEYGHALVSAMRLRRYDVALELWRRLQDDPAVVPSAPELNVAMSAYERSGRCEDRSACAAAPPVSPPYCHTPYFPPRPRHLFSLQVGRSARAPRASSRARSASRLEHVSRRAALVRSGRTFRSRARARDPLRIDRSTRAEEHVPFGAERVCRVWRVGSCDLAPWTDARWWRRTRRPHVCIGGERARCGRRSCTRARRRAGHAARA